VVDTEIIGYAKNSVAIVLSHVVGCRGGVLASDPLTVVNAASYRPGVAPGSIIAIFGANLAPHTVQASEVPLPTSLGGVSVLADDLPAPLYFVSPTQINAQLPYETRPGRVRISVGDSSTTIQVLEGAPGIFTLRDDLASLSPALPGRYLTVYLTGLGQVTPPVASGLLAPLSPLSAARHQVRAQIGGQFSEVAYAGLAPGMVGVGQLNLRVPFVAAGVHALAVSIAGAESAPVRVQVNPAAAADLLRMMWSQGRCTGQGPVRYSATPMSLADVAVVLPLGLMADAHVTPTDHQYWAPKDPTLGRDAYPVFAPADGSIVSIQHRSRFIGDQAGPAGGTSEFRIVFEHSCTFWTYYDLVTSLDPAIVSQLPGGAAPAGMATLPVRIPVRAGQPIGRIGGQTLDIGTVNADVQLPGLLVPENYLAEPWKIHTVDPIDHFDEPVRSRILELNPRKAVPRGGKIDYDIEGRFSGNWFLEATNGYAGVNRERYWSGHLAAAPNYLDPSNITISIGDYEGKSRQFWVRGNSPDPASVGIESGLVKYELIPVGLSLQGRSSGTLVYHRDDNNVQAVMLVQLIAPRRLRLQLFPGRRASDVAGFSDQARLYER